MQIASFRDMYLAELQQLRNVQMQLSGACCISPGA